MVLGDKLVVIARLGDAAGDLIVLQDFVVGGKNVIPVFSNRERFETETLGSGFEAQGVEIDRALLASLLTGAEVLVLNPGSTNQPLSKENLDGGQV